MVQQVSPLDSEWLVSSWAPLPRRYWCELGWMEGCALLFEEGGDESSMIGSLGTEHCEVRKS